MHVGESVKMAISSIRANKLRAGLTLLSISIGVFAIVGVAAAVGALNAKVDDQLSSLGRNSFLVQKTPAINFGGNWRKYANRRDITLRQGLEFKRRMTSADLVGLSDFVGGALIKYDDRQTDPNIYVIGTDETFLSMSDYTLKEGRALDARDVQLRSDVAVLGADIVTRLFPNVEPLGKVVRINGHPYIVIGVLDAKGAIFGQSQDNRILIPITSSAKYFFDEWGTSIRINVRSTSMGTLEETMGQAISVLRAIRKVPIGVENDFEIESNESLSDTFGGLTQYISWFGIICGAIALLAAGVGIMNIMLVSVKERTREIGIRKAVGATSGNILSQFILEAVTLCQLGALIGVTLGLCAGLALGGALDLRVPVPWVWVGVSIGTCLFVGLVFGSYPAWKASRLDPIDALRYE